MTVINIYCRRRSQRGSHGHATQIGRGTGCCDIAQPGAN